MWIVGGSEKGGLRGAIPPKISSVSVPQVSVLEDSVDIIDCKSFFSPTGNPNDLSTPESIVPLKECSNENPPLIDLTDMGEVRGDGGLLIDFSESPENLSPLKSSVLSCEPMVFEVNDTSEGTPFQGDPRPYLTVKVFDREVVALMDTGATQTCFGKGSGGILGEFQISIRLSPNPIFVRTADGVMHHCEELVDVPFQYNNETHLLSALLVPDLASPLILGMNFWRAFGLKMIKPMTTPVVNEVELSSDLIHLSQEQKTILDEAIKSLPITTSTSFGCTSKITHTIDTGDNSPVHERCYPVPTHLMGPVDEELDRLLQLGVLRECEPTPWLNPVTVRIKKDKRIRFCLDARRLNSVTTRDTFPLPHIESILSQLTGTRYLSSIDLSEAFFQIPLDPESQCKTAFALPGRKLYCFQRTPFGLVNSPMTMARLMAIVLGHDLENKVYHYLDDILIVTEDFSTHVAMLKEVARRLREANLTVNLSKSRFCVGKLTYLGYDLSSEGVSTNTAKVDAILQLPIPNSIKGLRQVIGMLSWYRKFIPDFATVIAPLTDLLKGKPTNLNWTTEADEAFSRLKQLLASAPILATPNYDLPFRVKTDASDFGCGGVLVQGEGDQERVIAYMSRKFTSAERNYTTTEKELLGVIYSIEKFRQYLVGAKFHLETDHSALIWLLRLKDAKGRLARWILSLQEYDFEVTHRPGRENVVPDALSRCFDLNSVVQLQDKWYSSLFTKITDSPSDHPEFRIENGRLYKNCRIKNPLGVIEHKWKLVVPREDREDLLRKYHNEPVAGHFGFFKTFNRLAEFCYWPKMRQDVKKWIKKCDVCKGCKAPNTTLAPSMGKHVEAKRPWEFISADYIGPLVRSSHGYTNILVLLDKFTKFVLLFPLRNAKTPALIRVLNDHVFNVFGYPRCILTDNGVQFESREFKTFLEKCKVTHYKTPYYHPQSNPTERVNRTIISSIRAFIQREHKEWAEHLHEIQAAINSSVHEASKFSPYYLNFGQNMVTSGDQYDTIDVNPPLPVDVRLKELASARGAVGPRLRKAHEDSARNYNLRTRDHQFSVGDLVWRRNFLPSDAAKGTQHKFFRWVKCQVVSVHGNTYELRDLNNNKIGKYHKKDIKPD